MSLKLLPLFSPTCFFTPSSSYVKLPVSDASFMKFVTNIILSMLTRSMDVELELI